MDAMTYVHTGAHDSLDNYVEMPDNKTFSSYRIFNSYETGIATVIRLSHK